MGQLTTTPLLLAVSTKHGKKFKAQGPTRSKLNELHGNKLSIQPGPLYRYETSSDMAPSIPSRIGFSAAIKAALATVCLLASAASLFAQPHGQPQRSFSAQRPAPPRGSRPQQEHLSQWMDRHRNLPLPQQQQALQNEPGFRDLPQQTQQRMQDRLTQLNNMPPEQRRRLLERTEAMERLSPPQRQQVRGAMQQLSSLPVDRRRLVARAFRDIREMPLPQREAILNSDRFRSQFSDQERTTLSNLLTVEPYLPVQRPSEALEYGK
jgi:hypothetical protein